MTRTETAIWSALIQIHNIVDLAEAGKITQKEAMSAVKIVLEKLAPKEEEKELLQ